MVSLKQMQNRRSRGSVVVDGEPMMTTTEVSRMLHVHPNTLRRWTDEGMITAYRFGSRADRRYREDDIGRFLRRNRTARRAITDQPARTLA